MSFSQIIHIVENPNRMSTEELRAAQAEAEALAAAEQEALALERAADLAIQKRNAETTNYIGEVYRWACEWSAGADATDLEAAKAFHAKARKLFGK